MQQEHGENLSGHSKKFREVGSSGHEPQIQCGVPLTSKFFTVRRERAKVGRTEW